MELWPLSVKVGTRTLELKSQILGISWNLTKSTRLPSDLRPTTHECVVTSGHETKMVVTLSIFHNQTTQATHKFHGSIFVELKLVLMQVSHCVKRVFQPFLCSCNLELGPVTFIYEPDSYSLEIQKLLSDRQRDRHDQNYIPRHFAGGN